MNEELAEMLRKQIKEVVIEVFEERQHNEIENTSDHMNKKETCEYIKRSNNTLDRLIKNQNFPVIKKGRAYFFSKKAIDNWMKNN